MADPKDEITTQDILAQYGPTPQAKPKDEHGFAQASTIWRHRICFKNHSSG